MTLRNSERTYLHKENFEISQIFLREIHLGNCVKFVRWDNKTASLLSILGHLIRKCFYSWQIFDNSGVFTPNYVVIQKNAFLLNIWKQQQKGARRTDTKKPLPESILNNLNCPKIGFNQSRFPANFLKVFKKRWTAAL